MTVRELRRTPATNGPTDELLRAHQEGEAHQDDDRVLPTEAVNIVVIRPELELDDRVDRLEETIHNGGGSLDVHGTQIQTPMLQTGAQYMP